MHRTCHGLWNDKFRKYRITWWRHQMGTFSALLAFCAGNSPVPVNSPHKGQWLGALMFPLICAWVHGCANNREADDSRCHSAHYDVTVMACKIRFISMLWAVSVSVCVVIPVFAICLIEWLTPVYILRAEWFHQNKSVNMTFSGDIVKWFVNMKKMTLFVLHS